MITSNRNNGSNSPPNKSEAELFSMIVQIVYCYIVRRNNKQFRSKVLRSRMLDFHLNILFLPIL